MSESRRRLLLPGEHGAWAMLGLPFISALALSGHASWTVIPAAAVVLGVFLVRAPLVALWRARDREAAWFSLAWYAPPAAAGAVWVLSRLPLIPVLILSAIAIVLSAISVWLTAGNRQRSVALEVVSAAGLNASALVAWLSVEPSLNTRIWTLWALQFAHSIGSILTVHALLEARIASRRSDRVAWVKATNLVAQVILFALACWFAARGEKLVWAAITLPVAFHVWDMTRLESTLRIPLKRIGVRELIVSAVFSALVVAGLR